MSARGKNSGTEVMFTRIPITGTKGDKTMTPTTLSIDAQLFTNEVAPIGQMAGEDGLIEVERNDESNVTVHFRHVNDVAACFSGETTRAGAIALAEALRSAAD